MHLEDLLRALSEPEASWQDSALCAQTDPDAWFPDKGGSTRSAMATCKACEVRSECLEYALKHDEMYGIWGGVPERERQRIRAQRNREAGALRKADTRARDAEIAQLDVEGAPAWQVAEQVGVSPRTVVRSRRRREAA
jgi:WhiB family redox-sensing transcriptional regulator